MAVAHTSAVGASSGSVWDAWEWAPELLLAIGVAGGVFVVGLTRGAVANRWRQLAFFAALGAFLLSLQSPLDAVAGRLFAAHQIQHFLLRMIGPMLLALASPAPVLLRGLPAVIRRRLVQPVGGARLTRIARRIVGHPIFVLGLYVGTLYFWQAPAFHDMSILDDSVHYVMHVTMLLSGLLFWWCTLSPHAFPFGWRFGVRIAVLWISVVANILVGTYVFLSERVLYESYDSLGRPFGVDASLDEQIGGLLLWIPPSMMTVVALLVVVSRWMRADKVPATRVSESGPAPRPAGRPARGPVPNLVLALALGLFVVVLFAASILVATLALPSPE